MTTEPGDNPYVGPRTFTEEQRHLFFGREREAVDLFARVLSERLVLFYAQSGAGKSSLINTRLIPKLREAGYAVLPVARVSGELPSGVTQVDNVYLFNLMLSLDSSSQDRGRFANMPFSRFLHGLSSDDGRSYVYEETSGPVKEPGTPTPSAMPYVLIIDQFEELITTNTSHWQEREEFFRQVNQAMVDDPMLWVLLSFREDYIAPIEPYAPLMMDRMRARFYMERMGIGAALEAVRGPAEMGGRPFADGVAERLVKGLRQVRVSGQEGTVDGQYVEPVQLQVVCYQLWKNIESRPPGPITFEDLASAGDIDKALIQFYEEVLASVLAVSREPVTERQLRTWFEGELITPERTRDLVRQGDETTGDLPNPLVFEIQRRFLVRPDTRSGDTRIEIVHDRFVEPILASNEAWRAQNQNPLVLAAEAWLADGKSPRRLLFGEQLRSAQAQLDAATHELTEEERQKILALLESSARQERQRIELQAAQELAILEPQKYMSEMGWGVIFPAVPVAQVEKQKKVDAIRQALQPLLDHRKAEATLRRPEFYREFLGGEGYRPGETAYGFLARHGVGPGKADPSQMPYYLLIVGDPEEIPFEFQYQLDVQYAVGRVHFDTADEYRRYAESVVRAETGTRVRPRSVALFVPRPEDDPASLMVHHQLVQPLLERLEANRPDWSLLPVLDDYATKARLGRLLGGDETPALLWVGSHGMEFSQKSAAQRTHQGALICQDWPGPMQWRREPLPEFYFAADDLAEDAGLLGLVVFGLASWGAGTPTLEQKVPGGPPQTVAERPFLARLPQSLLGHPSGGALAFIGHVGLIWAYSFRWGRAGGSTGVTMYGAVVERLLDGYPVGAALEPFNHRYAELAAALSDMLDVSDPSSTATPDVPHMRLAVTDARNWILIGDPAVRLMVTGQRPDTAALELAYRVENLRAEGDRMAKDGDLAGAEEKYREVLEFSPWLRLDPAAEARSMAARTPLHKAKDLIAQGKIKEATALFEEAQRLDPALDLELEKDLYRLAAPYFLAQGREAARSGEYERAVELLGRAAELDPILDANRVVDARGLAAQYHVRHARGLAIRGNVDEAVAHYEKAREFDSTLKSEFDPSLPLEPWTEAARYAFQFFGQEGTRLAEQGDHEGAALAFDKAVALDPTLRWASSQKVKELIERYQRDREPATPSPAPEPGAPPAPAMHPKGAEPRAAPADDDNLLWFNGVHALTGDYWNPPMPADALASLITGEGTLDDVATEVRRERMLVL